MGNNLVEFPARVPSVADVKAALSASIDLVAEFKQRHGDCVALYDNDDPVSRQLAQTAYEQERPSFWTSASYHSQKACILQQAANYKPMDEALRYAFGLGGDYIAGLDSLVPLNDRAAIALIAQYGQYGCFVLVEDVLARRFRRMPPTRVTV